MTSRTGWPSWEPPGETLDHIAAVVAAHWEAAKAYRERVFWPAATSWTSWLNQQADDLAEHFRSNTYHFASGGKLIR